MKKKRNTPDIIRKIDLANIQVVKAASSVTAVFEAVLFLLAFRTATAVSLISVGTCSILSTIVYFVSRKYLKDGKYSHKSSSGIALAYYITLTVWGIMASYRNYAGGGQMLTFFIIQVVYASCVVMPPAGALILYSISFGALYGAIYTFDAAARVNVLNYIAFCLMIIYASYQRYKTVTRMLYKEREISNISIHDQLTGIRNRHALEEHLNKCLHKHVFIAIADVDKFKNFNDTYGHLMGDQVLQEVSRRLLETFKEENCFRYGGDEFLIIADDTTEKEFREKLDKWQTSADLIAIPDVEQISVSYGVAGGILQEPDQLLTLLGKADRALYAQKEEHHKNEPAA